MKKMFLVLLVTLTIVAVAMFSYSADGGAGGTCGYVCHWDLDDEGDRCVAFIDDTSECLLEEEEGILRCRGWANACGGIAIQ